jgi:Fe-S cluster biogenesis protein NfuA
MGSAETAIRELIREVVGPLVRADGGEVHLVSLAPSSISLHLSGRFSGCPGNTLARRRVIEPLLSKQFPDLKIEITSGPRVPQGAETM